MKQKVTIVDVAKLAGVSTATAGRVVGGYSNVTDENRKKVLDAVEALQYTPNRMAQGLKNGSSKTLAVVVQSFHDAFFGRLVYAMEREAESRGWSVIVCDSHWDPKREREILRSMRSRQVDGIALLPAVTSMDEIPKEDLDLYRGEIPVTLIDTRIAGLAVGLIEVDNRRSTYKATRYLLEMGHERIGVVTPPGYSTILERIGGYRDALAEKGVSFDPGLVTTAQEGDPVVVRAKAARMLDAAQPTAIIAMDLMMTAPTLMELRERGVRIPEDMSFIGWDDDELKQLEEITAISQPVEEMGKLAVRRLMQAIEHPGSQVDASVNVLNTTMVLRRSCRPPRNVK